MNAHRQTFLKLAPIFAALVIAMPNTVFAAAGKFQFVTGDVLVKAQNSQEFRAAKGGEVNEGDTIVSGKSGFAQLLMEDGGKLAVKADTQVKIETFKYSGKEDGSERALFALVKGGLRAVTGEIGRTNKQNYLIKTPSATIGIRGTDHEPYYIPVPAAGETALGVPGTYDKVNSGATVLSTSRGMVVIQPGRTGFVSDDANKPILLPQTPDFFVQANDSFINRPHFSDGANTNKTPGSQSPDALNNSNKPISFSQSAVVKTAPAAPVPVMAAPAPAPLVPAPTPASATPAPAPVSVTPTPTAVEPAPAPATPAPTPASATPAPAPVPITPTPAAVTPAPAPATPAPTPALATPAPAPVVTPTPLAATPAPTPAPAPATPTPAPAPATPTPSPATATPTPAPVPVTPTSPPAPNAMPAPLSFAIPLAGNAPAGAGAVDSQLMNTPSMPGVTVSNVGAHVVGPGGSTVTVNSQGVVTGGTTEVNIAGSKSQAVYSTWSKTTLLESGADAATGIYWGRWAQGKNLKDGFTVKDVLSKTIATGTGSNHVMYSPHVTSAAELAVLNAAASGPNANPQVVNATYTYVGGTSPTRSDGAVGSINSMTVKANFSSQMVTAYDLNLQFGTGASAQVWDAHLDPAKAASASFANFSGTGPSAFGGSPGIDLAGTCSNCGNGNPINGSARGLFTGNDARGLMTSFQLQNGTNGASVNGAAALKR